MGCGEPSEGEHVQRSMGQPFAFKDVIVAIAWFYSQSVKF